MREYKTVINVVKAVRNEYSLLEYGSFRHTFK